MREPVLADGAHVVCSKGTRHARVGLVGAVRDGRAVAPALEVRHVSGRAVVAAVPAEVVAQVLQRQLAVGLVA